MIQSQKYSSIFLCLLSIGLAACASGPEKPELRSALNAEEAAADQPVRERNDTENCLKENADGTTQFTRLCFDRPKQIAGPTMSLPPEAIANYVMGTWFGVCIITEAGSVERCRVVKGLPYSNRHIIEILQAQKYTPVIYRGQPQRVSYTFKITFQPK